jgi:uncharacterized protein YceH (UPF0502 family)
MPTSLEPVEARALGSLIEKSYTTPDQYPLSFNALLGACNQKTSREPVMSVTPDELAAALSSLQEKGLAAVRHGSRVPKYSHYGEHLGAGDSPEVLGTIALLLLRGPQTAAEIRVRTERIAKLEKSEDAAALLEKLANDPDGPFVARGSRGKYHHLFSDGAPASAAAPVPAPAGSTDRISELEKRVATLEKRLDELTANP